MRKFIFRTLVMLLILPNLAMAEQAVKNRKTGLCSHMEKLVSTGQAFKLEPDYENNPPRGSDYRNIDLDGDGVVDSVKSGCGTGECLLEVKLSSGGEFDLDEDKFYLIRYQSRIYALVSQPEDEDSKGQGVHDHMHLIRLYLITSKGPKLVCGR